MNKSRTISDLSKNEILQLFRHWRWADLVRDQHLTSEMKRGQSILSDDWSAYRCIWYGLLYVLIDFLRVKSVCIQPIVEEIRKVRDPLRHFRNAVFHIDEDVVSDKFFMLLAERESTKALSKVHSEIEASLLKDLNRRIFECRVMGRGIGIRPLKEISSLREFDPISFLMARC